MRGFPFATDKRSFASLDLKAITEPIKRSVMSVSQWEEISLKYGFIQFVKDIVLLKRREDRRGLPRGGEEGSACGVCALLQLSNFFLWRGKC